jgi:hypothetical protein
MFLGGAGVVVGRAESCHLGWGFGQQQDLKQSCAQACKTVDKQFVWQITHYAPFRLTAGGDASA